MAYVPEDNRAMLRKENWDVPLQAVWDPALVLGKVMPVEETDSLAVRWMTIDNDDADTKVLEPGMWDIGTDFPEVGLSELGYDSTVINGKGLMIKFDPKRIFFNDGALDIADGQRRVLRKWAKVIEGDIFSVATNSRYATHGGEFDSVLTDLSGGISTHAKAKNLVFTAASGKAFNKEGDAVQTFREVATSITSINRLANLGGDIEFDPRTSAVYLDPLTYGALHDQLRDQEISAIQVGTGAISVPSLYGMTFAVADNAIKTNGDALMMDLAATPLVYKQALPPLPGYRVVGFDGTQGGAKDKTPGQVPASNKLSLLVKDSDDENGGVSVRFAHMGAALPRKRKSMAYFQGLFEA